MTGAWSNELGVPSWKIDTSSLKGYECLTEEKEATKMKNIISIGFSSYIVPSDIDVGKLVVQLARLRPVKANILGNPTSWVPLNTFMDLCLCTVDPELVREETKEKKAQIEIKKLKGELEQAQKAVRELMGERTVSS